MLRQGDKRERLVEAARRLFHQQGFGQTTLADIAETSRVPLGNVYYYFKTKDDIGAAVIDEQTRGLRALFGQWEGIPDARQRLITFVEQISRNREQVARYGCPMGSLCQELNKGRGRLAESADEMLKLQLNWVTKQFRLMRKRDATGLGQQLMATVQGISVLASALSSPAVVRNQVKRLKAWLRDL